MQGYRDRDQDGDLPDGGRKTVACAEAVFSPVIESGNGKAIVRSWLRRAGQAMMRTEDLRASVAG